MASPWAFMVFHGIVMAPPWAPAIWHAPWHCHRRHFKVFHGRFTKFRWLSWPCRGFLWYRLLSWQCHESFFQGIAVKTSHCSSAMGPSMYVTGTALLPLPCYGTRTGIPWHPHGRAYSSPGLPCLSLPRHCHCHAMAPPRVSHGTPMGVPWVVQDNPMAVPSRPMQAHGGATCRSIEDHGRQ